MRLGLFNVIDNPYNFDVHAKKEGIWFFSFFISSRLPPTFAKKKKGN